MRASTLVLVLVLFLAAIPALAGPTLTDPATFQSWLESSYGIEDFSSYTYHSQPTIPLRVGDTAYWLDVSAPGGLYIVDDHANSQQPEDADRLLRVLTLNDTMTIAFGPGINAFGAVMYLTNGQENRAGGLTTLTFTDSSATQFTYTLVDARRDTYLAYSPAWGTYLTTLTITGSNHFVSMDDVVAGFDTPEPGTILLCGIGLIAVGLLKRRR
ncbi:MAG TPA: PEP-CTERM sorting domain-containing protein [Bryobacteraceae bacterium]|nr:PEP-CTERM sorting domain-containing protein [Bryobacteraceae bacterium]